MSKNQGFDLGGLLGGLLGGANGQAAVPGGQGQTGGQSQGQGQAPAQGGAASGLVGKLMPMLMSMLAGGGLQKVMGQLSGGGLGSQAKSWVSTDTANEPVTGDQLTQALGPETVRSFASTAGVSEEEAAQAMAQALPQVVDAMSPQGELPQEMPDMSSMQAQINKLFGGSQ